MKDKRESSGLRTLGVVVLVLVMVLVSVVAVSASADLGSSDSLVSSTADANAGEHDADNTGVVGVENEDIVSSPSNPTDRSNLSESVRFIRNVGQTGENVEFTARGSEHAVGFKPDELVFSAVPRDNESTPVSVRARFVNSTGSTVEGMNKLPGVANFFEGDDPDEWYSGVPTYDGIAYRDLYPGVDLVYKGSSGHLKSEYLVAPGGDPTSIRMDYTGVEDIVVRDDGSLVVKTGEGELVHDPPVAYQTTDGERTTVEARYVVNGHRVGFELGSYDESRTLVIDPVLGYSTFLGGTEAGTSEASMRLAVDDSGNAYVSGETTAPDFPTRNAAQPNNASSLDIYVTKFDPTGNVVYSTYFGGSGGPCDEAHGGIAADELGNAYILGFACSADIPTRNAVQPNRPGKIDAFVTRFNSTGSIAYSTYLGGSDLDRGFLTPRQGVSTPQPSGIAVDDAGNAVVTGNTDSEDFPTVRAFQPSFGGTDEVTGTRTNVFVTKFNRDGIFVYSTYLGAGAGESVHNIASDDDGNAYVVGETSSTPLVEPEDSGFLSENPLRLDTLETDVFVTKFNPTGGVVYSTPLGGDSNDAPGPEKVRVEADTSGNAYVTGPTFSTDFPTLNAFEPDGGEVDTSPGGTTFFPGTPPFLTKFGPNGNLVYSTFLPNSSVTSHAVDPEGNVYATGSAEEGFPTTPNAVQPNKAGPSDGFSPSDGFVTKLDPGGDAVYSTYFGGATPESFDDIAVDTVGDAYVVGETDSTDYPIKDSLLPEEDRAGDAVVTKFRPSGAVAYSTFLGGVLGDTGIDIEAQGTENAYVVGRTDSQDFPTQNAFDTTTDPDASTSEPFVTKLVSCVDTDDDGNGDDDGDGLCDNWEDNGVDIDDDGNPELDLPAMGAQRERKDIFVEIDYMRRRGPGESLIGHQPQRSALQNVADAFANAPVSNPDGNPDGINLHLRVDLSPTTPRFNLPESQALPHQNVLNFTGEGPAADFDDVKDNNFGAPGDSDETLLARRLTHRYGIFGHRLTVKQEGNVSGRAEGIPGNDFIVTLGRGGNVGSRIGQESTLMHEFGHTLGLRHGGGDNVNCKPNYLSVMSYSRQFPNDGLGGRPLDYSPQQLPTLDESNLNEPQGVQGPAGRQTLYDAGSPKPPGDPDNANFDTLTGPANGPINWNNDTDMADNGVARDINWLNSSVQGECNTDDERGMDELEGHDDWENLEYNFRNVPDFADGVHTTPPGIQEQPAPPIAIGSEPLELAVETNVSSVEVNSTSGLLVNVTAAGRDIPVDNATVNVTGAGVDVVDATTDSNGTATFGLTPDETGDITVKANKSGFVSSQTTVQAGSDVVDRYDTDGDGIDTGELQTVINDFIQGVIDTGDLQTIINNFIQSQS